jgi:hypothetical protein
MKPKKKIGISFILILVVSAYALTMLLISVIPTKSTLNAVNDVAVVAEDSQITINVLENDTDNDKTTLAIDSYTQGANGSVFLVTADKTLRYTPRPGFFGTDTFTYTIKNSAGETKTATVSVTIVSVNDLPQAEHDSASVTKNSSVLIDVLANDEDPDSADVLVITSVNTPTHGIAVIENGKIRYTPNADFVGTDIFYYMISDGNGGTSEARITVTVVLGD